MEKISFHCSQYRSAIDEADAHDIAHQSSNHSLTSNRSAATSGSGADFSRFVGGRSARVSVPVPSIYYFYSMVIKLYDYKVAWDKFPNTSLNMKLSNSTIRCIEHGCFVSVRPDLTSTSPQIIDGR